MGSMAYHQQEIQRRVSLFDTECEAAIENIMLLKAYARSFVDDMPLGQAELKEQFLMSSKKLNELMYHITEVNLTLSNLGKEICTETESTASKDPDTNPSVVNGHREIASASLHNKEDKKEQANQTELGLGEHKLHQTQGPLQTHMRQRKEISNKDQISNEGLLSSKAFCSADSISESNSNDNNMSDSRTEIDEVGVSPPPQTKLTPGTTFQATIISVDGANLWLIEDAPEFVKLTEDITEYYKQYEHKYTGDIHAFNYCVYFDEDGTACYFRALHIKTEASEAEVYLLDTGVSLRVSVTLLRRIASRFCSKPPLAHCCHLADVDLPDDDELGEKQSTFLSEYLWRQFTVKLEMEDDDETSEYTYLGVYIYLNDGTTLNEKLMHELATTEATQDLIDATSIPQDNDNGTEEQLVYQPPASSQDNVDLDGELDFSNNPEYENPVEAVTGYDNRDEMDICKHYNGGEGCFKGARCKKRHVTIHPDGWTLDRVPVAGKCRAVALPAPGTRHKVKVTHVLDACRFYVHFEHADESMTLSDLVEEMTRAGASGGRLKLVPAIGELVSARFTDGRWYRARVTGYTERGTTEVMYIDFGNEGEVSDSEMTSLAERWLSLPAQAVLCRLAGVRPGVGHEVTSPPGVEPDSVLRARVIARGYDELTLELFDLEDFSVAEQLCLMTGTTLEPYEVEDDSRRLFLLVPA